MTTVGANFVSTNFLANSLVGPVMQAQSQLTNAMTEMSTGEYADLGLQLGDQSGYELSLKEQVGQLQTLTTGNSVVSTNLSTAQNALSAIQKNAQTTLNNLAGSTPSGASGASLQNMGQSGFAVADQRGQHDIRQPICVRRHQFRRRAGGGLLFDPGVCR
jgi:flagellar hook-associated protein 3 FlgL